MLRVETGNGAQDQAYKEEEAEEEEKEVEEEGGGVVCVQL